MLKPDGWCPSLLVKHNIIICYVLPLIYKMGHMNFREEKLEMNLVSLIWNPSYLLKTVSQSHFDFKFHSICRRCYSDTKKLNSLLYFPIKVLYLLNNFCDMWRFKRISLAWQWGRFVIKENNWYFKKMKNAVWLIKGVSFLSIFLNLCIVTFLHIREIILFFVNMSNFQIIVFRYQGIK